MGFLKGLLSLFEDLPCEDIEEPVPVAVEVPSSFKSGEFNCEKWGHPEIKVKYSYATQEPKVTVLSKDTLLFDFGNGIVSVGKNSTQVKFCKNMSLTIWVNGSKRISIG